MTMYLADYNQGVVLTEDFGTTVADTWAPATVGNATDIVIDGDRVVVVAADKVSVSTDGGTTFTSTAPNAGGLPTTTFKNCCIGGSGDVYLGTSNRGIYKSTDDGVSWSFLTVLNNNNDIYALAYFGSTFYVFYEEYGTDYLKTSDDNLATLDSRLTPNAPQADRIPRFREYDSTVYLVTGNNEVHYSSNVTTWNEWSFSTVGVSISGANDVWVSGSTAFIGSGSNTGGNLAKSTDGGSSWSYLDVPSGGYVSDDGPKTVWSDGTNIWISNSTGFYKSVDGMTGNSWTQLQTYTMVTDLQVTGAPPLIIDDDVEYTEDAEWTDTNPTVNAQVKVSNSSTLTLSGVSEWSDVTFGVDGEIDVEAGSSLSLASKAVTVVPNTKLKIKPS